MTATVFSNISKPYRPLSTAQASPASRSLWASDGHLGAGKRQIHCSGRHLEAGSIQLVPQVQAGRLVHNARVINIFALRLRVPAGLVSNKGLQEPRMSSHILSTPSSFLFDTHVALQSTCFPYATITHTCTLAHHYIFVCRLACKNKYTVASAFLLKAIQPSYITSSEPYPSQSHCALNEMHCVPCVPEQASARACSRAKSVGMKRLRRGRCSSGGGAAASQRFCHSAGISSLLYCVPYQGSRSVATSCRADSSA